MVEEILPLASWRAGGWTWEYEFPFGGGLPPWTSSLSQGTGLQALARSAQRLGREADILPVIRRAITVFQVRPPSGVRVRTGRSRAHYAQYSFAPRLRILNGFVQSLVGLFDYATITGDATGRALFEQGERQAEREVPLFDTGAWSLYSRGTSTHESDLSYHVLLRDFLANLCDRTDVPVFCDTAQHFTDYLTTPPVVRVPGQRPRAGRWQLLRLRLDKMSALTVTVSRRGRTVLSRSLGTLAHGTIHVGWSVPRHRGLYLVQVSARDLAGNTSETSRTIRVRRHG
jgi:D-glucuronyl C5-epimerase C-terminus